MMPNARLPVEFEWLRQCSGKLDCWSADAIWDAATN